MTKTHITINGIALGGCDLSRIPATGHRVEVAEQPTAADTTEVSRYHTVLCGRCSMAFTKRRQASRLAEKAQA